LIKKITFYYIGFIQTITYLLLSFQEHFYGEVIENIFYLITMIIGIFIWKNNLTENEDGTTQILPKKLSNKTFFLSIICTITLTLIIGYALTLINSNQAYIDASTNVIAVIAQILMIKGYKEQWLWWLILNILCLIMWFNVGNISMVSMYIAWIINCIYGWFNYNKVIEKNKQQLKISKHCLEN
jgi:nicotinamide mononucleotide transporter